MKTVSGDGYREHVHRPGRNECGAARGAYSCTLAAINVLTQRLNAIWQVYMYDDVPGSKQGHLDTVGQSRRFVTRT